MRWKNHTIKDTQKIYPIVPNSRPIFNFASEIVMNWFGCQVFLAHLCYHSVNVSKAIIFEFFWVRFCNIGGNSSLRLGEY